MLSPACEVKDGAGAYQATTNGVDVTPGNTVTIHLIDTSADTWSIECAYTDDTSDAATVTAALTIDSNARTATFTAPAAGKAYIFRSRVNNGVGPDGRTKSSYTTTFGVYTLTSSSLRVLASNETTEGSSSFGWSKTVNDTIRASGGGGGGDVTQTGAQTLTNKTISLDDNTVTATSGASGDLVRHDGTKFTRLARGAANTVLKANSTGTGTSFGLLANANIDPSAAIAGSKIAAATTGAPGAMSATDKSKLDGMQKQGGSVAVAAMDIDWSLGGVFTKTLAAGSNTFTFSNSADGWLITVIVTSDAGGSTLSWPSGVYWTGGAEPIQTEMGGTDVYTFVRAGSNIYGSVVQGLEASA